MTHRPILTRRRQTAQDRGRSIPDNDSLATDDRGTKRYRDLAGKRPFDTQSEHPVDTDENLDTRVGGETGEDEDLPDDDGGTETETQRGNVVRSPRNFDDGSHR